MVEPKTTASILILKIACENLIKAAQGAKNDLPPQIRDQINKVVLEAARKISRL